MFLSGLREGNSQNPPHHFTRESGLIPEDRAHLVECSRVGVGDLVGGRSTVGWNSEDLGEGEGSGGGQTLHEAAFPRLILPFLSV